MITETEGIILRQTKISGGRRMLQLFTGKFGKISAGIAMRQSPKGKNSLAVRPFTYGRYELYKKGSYFNVNSGETIESYYTIGENIDRYMGASFCLELTNKILPEEVPAPGLLHVLRNFLDAMNRRDKKFGTLVCAYQVKALSHMGHMPKLDACVACGSQSEDFGFSIPDGGRLCVACQKKQEFQGKDRLIYDIDFGIVNVVKFLESATFQKLEKLALQDDLTEKIDTMLRAYIKYHFDIRSFASEGLDM